MFNEGKLEMGEYSANQEVEVAFHIDPRCPGDCVYIDRRVYFILNSCHECNHSSFRFDCIFIVQSTVILSAQTSAISKPDWNWIGLVTALLLPL